MTALEATVLCLVAVIGHLMALFCLCREENEIDLSRDRIFDFTIKDHLVRRELKDSLHTPIYALILLAALLIGWFENRSLTLFLNTLVLTALWAEVWHYASHRAIHHNALHWILAELHKSHLSSPFTALSFSFTEKLIFHIGMIGGMAIVGLIVPLNFFGVAAWFITSLIVNSYGHANHELCDEASMTLKATLRTTTVYHARRHSRYTGNFRLGTRVLNRVSGTEWPDAEATFERVATQKSPLTSQHERIEIEDKG